MYFDLKILHKYGVTIHHITAQLEPSKHTRVAEQVTTTTTRTTWHHHSKFQTLTNNLKQLMMIQTWKIPMNNSPQHQMQMKKMANDIIKEAQNALANQEEMTSTKKASAKGKGAATAGKKSTSVNPSRKIKSPPFINETAAVDTEEQDISSDATGSMAGLGKCRDFAVLPFAKVTDTFSLP